MKAHFVAAALSLLFICACVDPASGQSTCPAGFRDVQIINACDNELWLGQQVASVGGAPGSVPFHARRWSAIEGGVHCGSAGVNA